MSISSQQRNYIYSRAGACCEYCRINTQFTKFQIDHIIPLKHNGTDNTNNLCLACLKCNGYKGPNVAALDPATGSATKLYDPRNQIWDNHFQINSDAALKGLTPEGRATIEVLRINQAKRIQARQLSMQLGEYPCKKPIS